MAPHRLQHAKTCEARLGSASVAAKYGRNENTPASPPQCRTESPAPVHAWDLYPPPLDLPVGSELVF